MAQLLQLLVRGSEEGAGVGRWGAGSAPPPPSGAKERAQNLTGQVQLFSQPLTWDPGQYL